MSHFAKVLPGGRVIKVIVAEQDFIDSLVEDEPCRYIQTSYNTRGGVHYDPNTGEPSADQSKAFRKNYAAFNYIYDDERDAFIPPKPYPSWTLNEDTCWWEPPVPKPEERPDYMWNEDTQEWYILGEF
jgi:hypothetical protein